MKIIMATEREPSTRRTAQAQKTYKIVGNECRYRRRIYRTEEVFFIGRPTLVAISTFATGRPTLVATSMYDKQHHHNTGESTKVILAL
jgi:hypothetical protein